MPIGRRRRRGACGWKCRPRRLLVGGALRRLEKKRSQPVVWWSAVLRPVPGGQEFRVRLRQGSALVVEDLQGEAGVELRVVNLTALEQAVLVAFDKVVVGVARKGQGAQLQGIDRRQLQQAQVRLGGSQVRQVEGNEVVPEQDVGAVSQPVEPGQCRGQGQVAAGKDQPLVGVGAHRGEGMDAGVFLADFQVEGRADTQRVVVPMISSESRGWHDPGLLVSWRPGATACGQLQHRCSKAFTCILHAARSMSGSVTGRATVWRGGQKHGV